MSSQLVAGNTKQSITVATTKAREYVARSVSNSTKTAYRRDWLAFQRWCEQHGFDALPATPETLALYLAAEADRLTVATLQRRLATISQAHKAAGYDSPTGKPEPRAVLAGIKREKGTAQHGKAPLRIADLRVMVQQLPETVLGIRDRALLLVGFAGGLRRSELVGLDVPDLVFTTEGVTARLRRSKTDQEGEGRRVGLPLGRCNDTCPSVALRAWLAAAGIDEGPVFRAVSRGGRVGHQRLTGQSVGLVVKRAAEKAGLDPVALGGHSLRAGLATSAAANGATERAIAKQTGHRSMAVLRAYIREGSLYLDNAAAAAGL